MILRLFRSVCRPSRPPSRRADPVAGETSFAECIAMIAGAM